MEDKTASSNSKTQLDATPHVSIKASTPTRTSKERPKLKSDEKTQKGSLDKIETNATKEVKKTKKKKKEPAKPKIILQSIAVADENSDSWSEEEFDSTELEVEIDEKDEELDNHVILQRIRRLGNQKEVWKNSSEFYAIALGYLISPDAILSAIYGFRRFGVATIPMVAVGACLLAMPVTFLELTLGQFTSTSCYSVFNYMAPILGGLPYLMIAMNLTVLLNDFLLFTMTANVVHDLLDSSATLQASQCFNKWNDLTCHNVVNPCASLLKKTGIEYIPVQGRCVQKRWYTDLLSNDLDIGARVRQQTPEHQFLVAYLTSVDDRGERHSSFPSVQLLFYTSVTFIFLIAAFKIPSRVVAWLSKIKMLMIFIFLTTVVFTRLDSPNDDFVAFPIKNEPVDWMNEDIVSWAVFHILLVSKIGQGGLISIGSQNHFRSNIFMNTLVIGVLSFLLPHLIAYLIHPFMDNMLWRIVHEFNTFEDKKDEFFNAHQKGFNTIWQDALIAFFMDKRDGQLFGTLFLVTLVLIFAVHKLIRLKTLIHPFIEQFGLEYSADLNIIRIVGLFWVMIIFWMNTLIPHKTESFYATLSGSAIIVIIEVVVIFIFYGPRRLLCNLNLMMFGLIQGSGDLLKTRARNTYNVLILFVFSVFMLVVPVYLMVLVIMATDNYIKHGGGLVRSLVFQFTIYGFVPLYAGIKIFNVKRRKQLIVNLLKPIPNLWGPREENDRKRAEYEERQLRI